MLTLAVAGALQSVAFSGFAQDAESSADDSKAKVLDKVSVTGSQIAGSGAQAAVPVISLSKEQVEATGATDGNELMRSLPQMGDVTWNPTFLSGANSNAARGDIGSINLRNMGASNTLLLVNGRRTVVHPTTATVDGGVSSTTYNSNAIPMYGLDRMDLLLDGAAAIYGSDAVAGVVNVVTQENLADGGGVKLQYGTAEGTHREDTELSGYFGKDFADGRGNVSVLYNLSHRSSQLMSDMWYTATSNRSSFVSPLTGGVTNGTSTYTPYGTFRRYSNGAALTGTYYVNSSGDVVSGSVPAALRTDTAAEPGITASPKTDRANIFTTAHFDLTDSIQLYGEAGYYRGKTKSWINSQTNGGNLPIYVDTDSYWVPDELKTGGADAIAVTNYLINSGIRPVEVTNTQYRALVGLRGWTDSGWNWDTGLLFSRANVKDSMITTNATKFVEAVNRTDASAYNVFSGGNNPGDTSAFMEWFTRQTTSELALWDFKVNRPDIFSWYAGDIGMAAGVEVRYESLKDDRGSIIDGTYTFTDWYTGADYASNLFGSSATPDSYGSRNVKSAFIEFAVPLVSADQGIPLVQSMDLQIAGRYEDYSDAGDVAKPKLALAWKVNDDLLLRGSASQGFKAPNLELVNSSTQSRFFGYPDYVRCEAMMANGTYSSWTSCIAGLGTSTIIWDVSGNKNLKPEVSKNKSAGFVYEPSFIPDSIGDFSFGIDWWKIDIENPIGVVSALTHLYYDAYLRVVEGSTDPAIVRNPVTPEDSAQFAGSGLDAVGSVNRVYLTYENLSPINAEGIDYNASWRLRGTRFGDFSVMLNASHLKSYSQAPTEAEQKIQQAINSGQLELTVAALGANQVGLNGAKPEWKGSATFVWKYDDWTVTARDQYTGSLVSGVWADRTPWKVSSQQRWNLAVKKDFKEGALSGYGFELGARNVFDKDPPLAADGTYLASLYEPYGRYLYMSVEKTW